MIVNIEKSSNSKALIKWDTGETLKENSWVAITKANKATYDQQKLLMAYVKDFFDNQEKYRMFDSLRDEISRECEYGDWVPNRVLYRKNGKTETSDIIEVFKVKTWSYHSMTKKDCDHITQGAEEFCVKHGFRIIQEWKIQHRYNA